MLSLLVCSWFAQVAPPVERADWPQFLGPRGTNHAELPGARFAWPEKGPEVLWRVPIGAGYGGAAVRDGEVFLLDRDEGEGDLLRVFALADGKELWSEGYEAKGRLQFPGSRTVPAVREDSVYTVGGFGQVYCFDRKSHEVKWSADLAEVYGGELPMFGWSCSPLLFEDLVIVTALGPDVGLVAFDRKTGAEAWVTETVGYSHSTPALLNLLGRPQIVFLSTLFQTGGQDEAAPTTISSFDPKDGALLWRTETPLTRLPIPGPVQIDEQRFFVTGGYRGGSTLLSIQHKDGAYSFETLFHIERGAQIHPPLLHDGHLYVLVNENWNNERNRRAEGGLLCLGLDGKERWRTGDAPFFGRGNALLAGDHLLIQDGHSGVLRAVRATPEGYRPVGEANVFGVEDTRDHEMWAPMALAGGRLLMRSQEELVCLRL